MQSDHAFYVAELISMKLREAALHDNERVARAVSEQFHRLHSILRPMSSNGTVSSYIKVLPIHCQSVMN